MRPASIGEMRSTNPPSCARMHVLCFVERRRRTLRSPRPGRSSCGVVECRTLRVSKEAARRVHWCELDRRWIVRTDDDVTGSSSRRIPRCGDSSLGGANIREFCTCWFVCFSAQQRTAEAYPRPSMTVYIHTHMTTTITLAQSLCTIASSMLRSACRAASSRR